MTAAAGSKAMEVGATTMPAGRLERFLAGRDDLILVTGAAGFIGRKVLQRLLELGFRNIRCLVRPSSDRSGIEQVTRGEHRKGCVEIVTGNLLSRQDCIALTEGAVIVIHLAAGRGEKSYPDAFMNSVVTTRNLIDGALRHGCLRRFVNVSSFAVYDAMQAARVLDETCPVEDRPELRGDAYCFAKVRQDQIVAEYGRRCGLPYVIMRPGYVYGAGNEAISGRIGIDTFGIFLHLGGSNTIPLTYVDNCADAIALAGLVPGIDGEIFNVVDDELPSSRQFLRLYKRKVRRFRSIYLPHAASYALCSFWERFSRWSEDQLPPVFNRKRWHANWKSLGYSNEKLKSRVGWSPRIPTAEAMERYFEACRRKGVQHA
jgi:nucleoside-diphosphate-sugar epimerase